MERREFIRKSAVGSGCALAGTMAATAANASETQQQHKCKITVLKRTVNNEWNQEFRNREGTKCELFKDGQEFVLDSQWSAPEGFCHWAWADMRSMIQLVNEGKFETFVSCCTDGFRPVFFKIERIQA